MNRTKTYSFIVLLILAGATVSGTISYGDFGICVMIFVLMLERDGW